MSKLLPKLSDLIDNYKALLIKLVNNPLTNMKSKFNMILNQNLSHKKIVPKIYDINSANSFIIKSINYKYSNKGTKNQDVKYFSKISRTEFPKSRDKIEEEFETCPLRNQLILNYEQNKKFSKGNSIQNKCENLIVIPKLKIEIIKPSQNKETNALNSSQLINNN